MVPGAVSGSRERDAMIHRNSLLIGLIVGSIVAVILYFFVLERPADAADS